MESYAKHELKELVVLSVYVIFVTSILSLFFGFGAGGFDREEVFKKNNFYIPYALAFLVGLIALKVAGIFVFGRKNANVEGVVIHDPVQTPLGKLRLIKSPIVLILGSIIFFSIMGYLATANQTFYSDIPRFEQQFTPAADLFFSVYPASPSETLGALFLISLYGFALGMLALYKKISPTTFFVLFLVGAPLISMGYGLINHYARYGDSEIAKQSVMVFWFFGGLLTALTGSCIPFLVMHDANNFFLKLSELFSNEVTAFLIFSFIAFFFMVFIALLLRKKRKKSEVS